MKDLRLGPYRVERDLAGGGMGAVKLGRDAGTGASVALKLPHQGSEDYRELLRQEAELLKRLSRAGHPGIVQFVAAGSAGGLPWYAMEFVDGPNLRSFNETLWQTGRAEVRADAKPNAAGGRLQDVLRLLAGIADALACAHALGVVHCDLKPSNVLLRGRGEPVLVDFGASLLAGAGNGARESLQLEAVQRGTVGYMAPEQLRGGEVDARCDLYALGNIAYELLTGRAPFAAASAAGLAEQHLTERPPAPSRWVANLPPELDALVLCLLEKEPRRRATFASEVAERVRAWLPSEVAGVSARVTTPLFRPSLSGRGGVLERLMSRVERTTGGEGGFVILSGESGIGKTRATRELLRRLRGMAVTVVCGAGSEAATEGATPAGAALEPFSGCLRLLAGSCARDESGLLQRLALELAVLAPYEAAIAALPGLGYDSVPALPAPLARRRVLKSLRDAIVALAEPGPLVLVLDDLHAADELSLAFLASEHVAALARARVLIVGTRRAEQTNEHLRDALATNAQEEVVLERLSASGVRAMVSDMLSEELPPPEFVSALFRNSGGNPLYVAAFLQSAVDSGALARQSGRWQFPEPSPTLGASLLGNAGPAALHDVARLRLAALSDAEAELLVLASLLGHDFDPQLIAPLLAALHGTGAAAPPIVLDHLVARELLEPLANGSYRFTHAVLREAAGERVPAERAPELHRIAAQAKSAAAADSATLRAAYDLQIGVHWALGGRPDNALGPLEQAARRAEATHAYQLAIDVHTLAVEQCAALHASAWPARELDLSERLADLHARAAAYAAARRQYAFTIERAPGDSLRAARLWRKYAESHWKVHEYADGLRALQRASELLAASATPARENGLQAAAATEERTAEAFAREVLAQQQARFSIHYFMNPHGDETQELLREMLPRVEAHGTPQQKSYFYQCVANEAVGRNRYQYSEDAVASERRALAVLEMEEEGVIERALAEFDLGFMLLLGEHAACREAVVRLGNAALCAERYEDMTLLARAVTYQSIAHRRLRELEPARLTATRAQEVAQRAQVQPYVGVALANLAWVAWYEGNEERARSLLIECRRCWSGPHIFPFQWLATFVALDIQAADGDLAGAAESLQALVEARQQQLPRLLDQSLQRACTFLGQSDPQQAHRELMGALQVARDLGYV